MKTITAIVWILLLLLGCELFTDPPDEPNILHIAIALNYATTDVKNLHGTLNDANALSQVFELMYEQQYEGVMMLQDGSDDLSDTLLPTKDHVLDQIQIAIEHLQSNDLLIITYSGHGVADGSWVLFPTEADRKIFLADNKTPKPELLLSPAALFDSISSFEGAVLVIVDSCYAGNFVQENSTSISLVEPSESIQSAYNRYFSNGFYTPKVFVMAATTRDNTSKEPISGNPIHGYFTRAFLEGLGWDIAQQKLTISRHSISIDELYRYILEHQKIPIEGTDPRTYQHPLISPGPMGFILPYVAN